MVQYLKEEVETAIVDAALDVFARRGYAAATIGEIAKAAGISTGNVYRYFESKEALFERAIPKSFAKELSKLLRRRIHALSGVADIRSLGPDADYHRAAEELLRFTIRERKRVVVLLSRSEGTPYEGFGERTVKQLVDLAVDYAKTIRPKYELTPAARFALVRIYRGFVSTMVAILSEHDDEEEIRERVERFSSYHLAGLKGFFEA